MKSPAAKIHIIDIDEPLLGYHGLICRCGAEIRDAVPRFMFAEGMEYAYPKQTCQACIFLAPVGEAKRIYVYGLIEAQALKFQEAE